jgi:hypothetical protein
MTMTEHPNCRARRTHAWAAAVLPLLLAAYLGGATPSHAAPRNTIRYIQPVVSRGHVTTYAVCLYSTTEFPMRNEVITLSIGGKTFINSSYVQGGDLHTILFSLTQSDYQALKNGDPVAVFYGQNDALNPAAQWSFGTLSGLPTKPAATTSARIAPQRGKK